MYIRDVDPQPKVQSAPMYDQDQAQLFVVAWMSLGSVKRVARRLRMTVGEVMAAASSLRDMGVKLPQRPVLNTKSGFGYSN